MARSKFRAERWARPVLDNAAAKRAPKPLPVAALAHDARIVLTGISLAATKQSNNADPRGGAVKQRDRQAGLKFRRGREPMKILVAIDGSAFSLAAVDFIMSRRTLLGAAPDLELFNVQ